MPTQTQNGLFSLEVLLLLLLVLLWLDVLELELELEIELELELDLDELEDEVGPVQSVMRCTVYSVGHGALAEHPSLHVHLMLTVGAGSGQPQCAVSVERMAHGGHVHENGQTVSVAVTVGQMGLVRAGAMGVI